MNITFISPHPGFGGASTANQNIAKMLSMKHSVTYIDEFLNTPSYPNSTIQYSKFPLHKYRIFKQVLAYRYLSGLRSDYILIGVPQICIYYIILFAILRIQGVKVGLIFHSLRLNNSIKNRIIDTCIAMISLIANQLFFVSKYTLDTWSSYKTIKRHRSKHIVYNAIEPTSFVKRKKSPRIKNIIFVGRFSLEKQPEIFCKLAQKLSHKYNFIAWGDGELKNDLEKKYAFCVTFKGFTSNQDLIYKESDLLIVTSIFENCPMILLEAWSYGIPCLAPNVGGIPELVKNNINGELFNSFNLDEIAEKIEYIDTNYQSYQEQSYSISSQFTFLEIGKIWNKIIEINKL